MRKTIPLVLLICLFVSYQACGAPGDAEKPVEATTDASLPTEPSTADSGGSGESTREAGRVVDVAPDTTSSEGSADTGSTPDNPVTPDNVMTSERGQSGERNTPDTPSANDAMRADAPSTPDATAGSDAPNTGDAPSTGERTPDSAPDTNTQPDTQTSPDRGTKPPDTAPPPCSVLDDDFPGTALSSCWRTVNPNAGTISVSGGQLHIEPNPRTIWFHREDTAPFLYKTLRGNFTITTMAYARNKNNRSQPVGPADFQFAGVMARNPTVTARGVENHVFAVVGRFNNSRGLVIENKNTTNGNSGVFTTGWASGDAQLRLCRVGSTYFTYARSNSSASWRLIRQFQRTDLPNVLQVGIIAYSYQANAQLRASFDYARFGTATTQADCTGSGGGNPEPPPQEPMAEPVAEPPPVDAGASEPPAPDTPTPDNPPTPDTPAGCTSLNDEFSGSALRSCWRVVNGNNMTYSVSNGRLQVIPTPRTVWFNREDTAPFFHKSVSGNFTMTTMAYARSVSNRSQPVGPSRYQFAGIMARNPTITSRGVENYVFAVVGRHGGGLVIEQKTTRNGSSSVQTTRWPSGDAQIRICRIGSQFRLYARANASVSWALLRTYQRTDLPNTLQLGPIAYAYERTAELHASFEYVRFGSATTLADCTR